MMLLLYVQEVVRHEDPHAIPYLIGLLAADRATFDSVNNGLRQLTGVEYRAAHDGPWWQQWWLANQSRYPADVQAIEIPDYQRPLTFAWREPTAADKARRAEQKKQQALADVADIPAQDLTVAGNRSMRYFLIGPRKNALPPQPGFKLVVVMPGGDGSEDFHPFVRRLYKHGMGDDYLAAQPVAVRWTPQQQTIWPTRLNPEKGQQFATEDFVEAVIQDVGRRRPIDKRFVFTLSWSSSGPAAYAIALQTQTAVTGSYVAMSVYRPQWHPPIVQTRGRAFLIEHSPQDKRCPYAQAQQAKQELLCSAPAPKRGW